MVGRLRLLRTAGAVVLALLSVAGALWVGPALSSPASHGSATVAAPSSAPASPGYRGASVAPSFHAHPSAPPASVGGRSLPASDILYPNPAHASVNPATGYVAPTFTSGPAPMGVSDVGVGAGGSYLYRTTSFEGTVAIRSLSAFQPAYVSNAPYQAPDWALLELNAVAVNVTYAAGAPAGVFWIQNAVHLNRTGFQLEDNIWNFSAPGATISPAVLSGRGHIYRINQFYAGFGTLSALTFPVTFDLFDNITTSSSHVVVHFGYAVVPASGPTISGTYDTVTFNGTVQSASPPQFEVDGAATTPSGSLYDAELVLGGNGGGANTNLVALNASATLRAWNRTAAAYRPVSSAYDFGSDSSETALGVAVHYANVLGTPAGTAYLETGPSYLYGLWNTTSGPFAPAVQAGSIQVQITTVPSYAFVFLNLSASGGGYSYAPSTAAGVMTAILPPGINGSAYAFDVYADGYAPGSASTNVSTTTTVTLVSSPTTLNAPVYLDGDAQARALANATIPSVGYSVSALHLWLNASQVALAPPFRILNALANPTFQLFAEQGLSLRVSVNALVQDPSTFNYTFYQAPERYYPGWTQGYFFFAGTGNFSVANTTIAGVTSLLSNPIPTFSAPTIELYGTHGSSVRSVSVSNDARGVSVVGASYTSVSSVTSTLGAQGVWASGATHLAVSGVTATGAAPRPSTGVILASVAGARISGVSATGIGLGLNSTNSTNVTVLGLNVTFGATGFSVNATNVSNVSWVNVSGGVTSASAAGNWWGSGQVSFADVAVTGSGLDLERDSVVTVDNSSATGAGSSVVQSFANSTLGTFTTISASLGAIGLNVSNGTRLTVRGLSAAMGSLGLLANDTLYLNGSSISSTASSTGVFWLGGGYAWFNGVNTSYLSVGVWADNATHITVTNVAAENGSLGPTFYLSSPVSLLYYPIAGVGLFNITNASVSNVQALYYPFAVWSNGTRLLTISNVVAWYGGYAVDVNATPHTTPASHISGVFAYGNLFGLFLENSSTVTVQGSTFEANTVLGLEIANGSSDAIKDNNFVANNGSSASGGYSRAHQQVWLNNTYAPSFSGNFWADSPYGTYTIYGVNGSARDQSTSDTFLGVYLEFTETGLVPGQKWVIALGYYPPYNSSASAIYVPYLPGLSLPSTAGRLPFAVVEPIGIKAAPRIGNVTWDLATLPAIPIVFGTPSTPLLILGLPVWAFAGLVAALVVVVLLVLLVRRRRHRPPAATAPHDVFDAELR